MTASSATETATPRVASAIEVRSIDYVPEDERHGKVWQQGPFWFLGNFQPFTLGIGLIGPGLGLSLTWTIVASLLGIAFGTFFMAFHASQGPQLGLPQMIQSRAQLGYQGVLLALAATAFTFIGFNVIDVVIIDQGLHNIFGWNPTAVGLAITALAVVLAIYGHDWLHRAFRILFFLSLPLWALLTLGVFLGHAGGSTPAKAGFTLVAFMVQFTVAASYNITYAPYVSDYSRYLPRDTKTSRIVAAVFFGAAGSPMWLIPLGAWMASRLGTTDALTGIHHAGNSFIGGLGSLLAVISVLALVATMGLNAYSGMLTFITAFDSFRPITPTRRLRVITILALGVIWAVIGIGVIGDKNATTVLNNTLLIMLYLLVPWTAVNLVDYFFVRRKQYAITDMFRPDGGIYGRWAWRGLAAYVIGILAEIPFAVLGSFYTGPIAKDLLSGVDYSFAVGLVVAGGAYYLFSRSLDLSAERTDVARSEAALAGAGSEPVVV
ncbi:MAG: putative purine-cytosine permease yxlA [Frankiales bacterium]|nr:putative purine-cytosine permease yxlA [Frankiales bacterium]